MSTQLNPYLQFRGEAREAMTFYESVFGGELQVMTFADLGGMGQPEESQGQVMHSALTVSPSINIFASDVPPEHEVSNGMVSLSGDEDQPLRAWFERLAEGGEVSVPLETAPWGDAFGQLRDRFGIGWLVNIAGG